MPPRAETRERILAKAEELFARYGAVRTSVADIARALRMSPANIYKSFASKTALMEAVGERRVAELTQHVRTVTRAPGGHLERIEALFTVVAEWIYAAIVGDKDFIKIEIMRLEHDWQFVHAFHDFLRQEIAGLVRSGIAAHELRDADPEDAAAALLDCLTRAIEPLFLMQDTPEVRRERLARQFRLLARALR